MSLQCKKWSIITRDCFRESWDEPEKHDKSEVMENQTQSSQLEIVVCYHWATTTKTITSPQMFLCTTQVVSVAHVAATQHVLSEVCKRLTRTFLGQNFCPDDDQSIQLKCWQKFTWTAVNLFLFMLEKSLKFFTLFCLIIRIYQLIQDFLKALLIHSA